MVLGLMNIAFENAAQAEIGCTELSYFMIVTLWTDLYYIQVELTTKPRIAFLKTGDMLLCL